MERVADLSVLLGGNVTNTDERATYRRMRQYNGGLVHFACNWTPTRYNQGWVVARCRPYYAIVLLEEVDVTVPLTCLMCVMFMYDDDDIPASYLELAR